jgi:hypothetical protein
MKRVRANGGSRTALKPEGIVILGSTSHVAIARALNGAELGPGESVAVRLAPAPGPGGPGSMGDGGGLPGRAIWLYSPRNYLIGLAVTTDDRSDKNGEPA